MVLIISKHSEIGIEDERLMIDCDDRERERVERNGYKICIFSIGFPKPISVFRYK